MRSNRTRIAVALLAGTAALVSPASAQFLETDARVLGEFTAEVPGDFFGWVGEAVGDVDGDGAADFVVGAVNQSSVAPFGGAAYVYSGATGTLLHVERGEAFEFLGHAVAGVGDVDGDGVPDYAVGAPSRTGGPGRVRVLSGADHAVLLDIVDPPLTFLGFDVAAAGDVDGDGHADILVGAPLDSTAAPFAGRVDVVSGRDGSVLWSTYGESAGANLGSAVGGLDDVNGDGVPEQGAGAIGAAAGGAAFVLDGATGAVIHALDPNGTAGAFGIYFISDAGDVDADGRGDVFVGDYLDARVTSGGTVTPGGRAYVFSGASGERIRTWQGENPGDGFGDGRGAGDVDGDGHDDLFVAAYLSSDGAPRGGKGYVLSGRNGKVLRTYTSLVPEARLGVDAIAIGDADGDGHGDYLLTGRDFVYLVAGTEVGRGQPLSSQDPSKDVVEGEREVITDRLEPDQLNMVGPDYRFDE